MKTSSTFTLYVALAHHPVVNKRGETIVSAVTNLDLHDISRAARTYGVRAVYAVTPLEDQKDLIRKIAGHWTSGIGAAYNPDRREALELIRVRDTLADVRQEIAEQTHCPVRTVVTCARKHPGSIGYARLRMELERGIPHLLVFGTAWGLTEECISSAEAVLEPISGNTGFNHLSVRSAAAIILDRLAGNGGR